MFTANKDHVDNMVDDFGRLPQINQVDNMAGDLN